MIVLGIDPGISRLGWGVIEKKDSKNRVIDYGCINTYAEKSLPERLKKIHKKLTDIVRTYKPEIMAVEKFFFVKNIRIALMVGQARGIALLVAGENKIKLAEYSALEVQRLAGSSRPNKSQMQNIMRILLNLKEVPKPDDAADALAIGLYHLHVAWGAPLNTYD